VRGTAHGYEIVHLDQVRRPRQAKPHIFMRNRTWFFVQDGRVFFLANKGRGVPDWGAYR
jgi:hypothetical protein